MSTRKIKEAVITQEKSGACYLRVVWEETDPNGNVVEKCCPRVRFPLEMMSLSEPFKPYWNNDPETIIIPSHRYLMIPAFDGIGFLCEEAKDKEFLRGSDKSFYYALRFMKRKMTVEEIEKELGYPIQIIKEKT